MILSDALIPDNLMGRAVDVLPEAAELAGAIEAVGLGPSRRVEPAPPAPWAGGWVGAQDERLVLSVPIRLRILKAGHVNGRVPGAGAIVTSES